MTTTGQDRRRTDWLLDDFVKATPGVRHALVISGDGLRLALSSEISTGLGDSLSAAASGLLSLARGAAALLDAEPVTQMIVEMAGGYFFVTSVSEGAILLVQTTRQCDMGLVGYEMTMLAKRVGHVLTPAARAPAPRTPAGSEASERALPRESPQ